MESITSYVYIVLWFAIALYMIVQAHKVSKWLYLAAAYFVFLGGWYIAQIVTGGIMFSGVYGWIFRGVSLVALAAFLLIYFLNKRKNKNK